MNMDALLAASGATDEFKDSVRQYSTHGKAPLVEAAGYAPPIKVMRVLAQLLEVGADASTASACASTATPGAPTSAGRSRRTPTGVVRQWRFVWCCRWRAVEQGWVDCFGFPDQMRAAREFGYRCFETWSTATVQ